MPFNRIIENTFKMIRPGSNSDYKERDLKEKWAHSQGNIPYNKRNSLQNSSTTLKSENARRYSTEDKNQSFNSHKLLNKFNDTRVFIYKSELRFSTFYGES